MRDTVELEIPAVDVLHHVPGFMTLAWRVYEIETEVQYGMFKKMIGSLVRDVMDELGFEAAMSCDTKISPVFSGGMRYRLRVS